MPPGHTLITGLKNYGVSLLRIQYHSKDHSIQVDSETLYFFCQPDGHIRRTRHEETLLALFKALKFVGKA